MCKDTKFFENLQKNCDLFLVKPYPQSICKDEQINAFFDIVISSIKLVNENLTELILETTMPENSNQLRNFYFIIDAVHSLNKLKEILENAVIPENEAAEPLKINISVQ